MYTNINTTYCNISFKYVCVCTQPNFILLLKNHSSIHWTEVVGHWGWFINAYHLNFWLQSKWLANFFESSYLPGQKSTQDIAQDGMAGQWRKYHTIWAQKHVRNLRGEDYVYVEQSFRIFRWTTNKWHSHKTKINKVCFSMLCLKASNLSKLRVWPALRWDIHGNECFPFPNKTL